MSVCILHSFLRYIAETLQVGPESTPGSGRGACIKPEISGVHPGRGGWAGLGWAVVKVNRATSRDFFQPASSIYTSVPKYVRLDTKI